jgi:cellulose biosynthesis protein BcsQ
MTRRRQTSYAEEFERELRAEFKANVFQTVIPETAAYKEYMFRHRQIPTDSRTYKSVQAFTQEVSARIKENS